MTPYYLYNNLKNVAWNICLSIVRGNIFRAASISDIFDQVYTGKTKKIGMPDEMNIIRSFTSKQNQPSLRKAIYL